MHDNNDFCFILVEKSKLVIEQIWQKNFSFIFELWKNKLCAIFFGEKKIVWVDILYRLVIDWNDLSQIRKSCFQIIDSNNDACILLSSVNNNDACILLSSVDSYDACILLSSVDSNDACILLSLVDSNDACILLSLVDSNDACILLSSVDSNDACILLFSIDSNDAYYTAIFSLVYDAFLLLSSVYKYWMLMREIVFTISLMSIQYFV